MSFHDPARRMLGICLGTLGITAEYIRGETRKTVKGIFDANYIEVDNETGLPVMSVGPVFDMDLHDLPEGGWQEGDKMEIEGVMYEIIEPRPDSESGISMSLQRISR